MIVLETEHGRFEADTHKAALRAARKAAKEASAKEAQNALDRETAYTRASANAYLCLLRKEHSSLRRGELCKPNTPCSPKVTTRDGCGFPSYQAVYNTANGPIIVDHGPNRPVGAGCDGGGWAVAAYIEVDGAVKGYAIGVCGEQWAFAELIGVTADDWQ